VECVFVWSRIILVTPVIIIERFYRNAISHTAAYAQTRTHHTRMHAHNMSVSAVKERQTVVRRMQVGLSYVIWVIQHNLAFENCMTLAESSET